MKPKILSSTIAHENPWYRVRHDTLEWPNGKPGEYFVAEFLGAAMTICIEGGKILTVRQYRYPIDAISIEFPNGGIKNRQTPEDAARAELLEEAGVRADRMERIGGSFGLNGIARNETHVFVASGVYQGEAQREESEQGMTAQWIPLEEWRWMIREGEVVDGETLAAWALYQEHRGQE